MADVLNTRKPFKDLDGKGGEADYVMQDGEIFAWSESNIRYERAWWLTDEGLPVNDRSLTVAVCNDRPFDPDWLRHGQ